MKLKERLKKLISGEELEDLLKDTVSSVLEVLHKSSDELDGYTANQALEVRNGLMAVATLRLGRRSKELLTMTIDEVRSAQMEKVGSKTFYIIKVLNQKHSKCGQEAPVAFEKEEFEVVELYIKKLRPKITTDCRLKIVFPPLSKASSPLGQELSLSSAWKIQQKFETRSGKKISSRVVRISKVTNSREANFTREECDNLASVMNHSSATAERHYIYRDVTQAVINS